MLVSAVVLLCFVISFIFLNKKIKKYFIAFSSDHITTQNFHCIFRVVGCNIPVDLAIWLTLFA